MRLRTVFPVALLISCELASWQTTTKPPCEYGGELLRQAQHKIKLFTSDEMKARATYKQDIFGAIKQVLAAYAIPFSRIPGSTTYVGCLVAFAFAVPVFFAGLLFAEEFREVDSPSSALAANMLGAVCGGLLENLSLIVGMRTLLLIAVGLYLLAVCGLRKRVALSPAS